MIERTYDSRVVNAIANHPCVLPWVTVPGFDEIDTGPILSDDRNIALMTDKGGFLFHWISQGNYEAHSLFLPEGRGGFARRAAHEAMRFMFTETDCETIWARCPENNKAVMGFTKSLAFLFDHIKPDAWPTPDGLVDEYWFRMSRPRWEFLTGAN